MNNYNFLDWFKEYKNELINNLMELIKIPSVLVDKEIVDGKEYPFGINNYKALQYVYNLALKMGFKAEIVDDVCLEVTYGEGKESVAVLCHLDVVPAIGNWTNPPFEPIIKDDKIYGRGSSDDKGPALASLYALYLLKQKNIKLDKKIILVFGTDEESGSRCLARYYKVKPLPDYAISPDANFPVIYAEKGHALFDVYGKGDFFIEATGGARYNVVAPEVDFKVKDEELEKELKKNKKLTYNNGTFHVQGKSAHAMEPDNGINAIKVFAKALEGLTLNPLIRFINEKLDNSRLKSMGLNHTSADLGDLTMNIGLLKMNDEARIGIDIRYPNGMDFDKFLEDFSSIAKEYGLKLDIKSVSKVHYIDPNSKFIKTLHNSYIKYTNDTKSPLLAIGGGTYCHGMKNAVAYGIVFPDEPEMAHEVDEYIKIESLIKGGAILADAIYELGNFKCD